MTMEVSETLAHHDEGGGEVKSGVEHDKKGRDDREHEEMMQGS